MGTLTVKQSGWDRVAASLARVLTPSRLHLYPMALLAITVAAYLAGAVRSQNLIEPSGEIIGRDYFCFFMAGEFVAHGRSMDLYDAQAQRAYQDEYMQGINPKWDGMYLFRYPPHFAWFMSLLTPAGYVVSLACWWALMLACFAAAIAIWRKWAPGRPLGWVIALAICFPPWFLALAGGQNAFLSLLILSAFCALIVRKQDAWAGLVLALQLYKFQLLLGPLSWLLFSRRWRCLGAFAAGTATTLILTVAIMGPGVVADYANSWTRVSEVVAVQSTDLHKQHSWSGFFQLLGGGWLPAEAAWILTALVSAATLFVLARMTGQRIHQQRWDIRLELCAMMLAGLLISPHLAHYDLSVVALPAILWWAANSRGTGSQPVWRPNATRCDTAASDRRITAILAIGFIWTACASLLAPYVRLQLTTVLLAAWMLELYRRSLPGIHQHPVVTDQNEVVAVIAGHVGDPHDARFTF